MPDTRPSVALSPEELATIKRFLELLEDKGVVVEIMKAWSIEYCNGSQEIGEIGRIVRAAISEVHRSCSVSQGHGYTYEPAYVASKAVTFRLLVGAARKAGTIPEDFIPSEAVANRCEDAFYRVKLLGNPG